MRMEMQAARERARRELEVTRNNLARAEWRKAPERDLEALRSKVDFWETVCGLFPGEEEGRKAEP